MKNRDRNIINNIEYCYENDKPIDKDRIEGLYGKLLSKTEKDANDYFILGYYSLIFEGDNKKAKSYFEKVINDSNEKKFEFAKLYSYYYLCKYSKLNNDIDKSIKYLQKGFNMVKPKDYGKHKKIIWAMHREVLESEKGKLVAIENLNKIKIHKNRLDDESKLYIYKRLSTLNFVLSNYTYAIENCLDSIELATKLDKRKELYKSIVDLGISAREIGEYESATKVIESADNVNIEQLKEKEELKSYQLINLAEIECLRGDYKKAIRYIEDLESYEKYINKEKLDDILILKNFIKCEYYTSKNEFSLAEMCLKNADAMLKNDSLAIYADKDLYLYKCSGNLYKKQKKYNEAIENYKKLLDISKEKKSFEYLETGLQGLIEVYSNIGDKKNSYKYSQELLNLKEVKLDSFSKSYYKSALHKYEIDKTRQENITVKTLNVTFKILIFILLIILFKFNIYPIIYKYVHRSKIKKYMKEDRYFLNYQPIVNPKENKIMGFEALIRLKLKDKLIMPNIIIEEINKCEMMEDLSVYILKRIVKDFNTIKNVENTNDKFYISINLSLKEIESMYIVETFKKIIKESNLPKGYICIEITENANYKNKDVASKNIEILKESGFLIALDDFGMEYSNISILEKFEFDIIKLDKYFIDNIETSPINKTLMETADYLSIIKDKTIVVEGVEENYQVKIIKNTKSSKMYIQGYFYSKPLSVKELEKFKLFK